MIFEEMMREERNEGRSEGLKEGRLEKSRENIIDLLEELGEVPEEFTEALEKETDETQLKAIHRAAAKSDSMAEFIEKVRDIWK